MLAQILHSQELTIGLLSIEQNKVSEGLVLFTPWYSKSTYLINNCGQLVNEWEHEVEEGLSNSVLDNEGNLFLLRNELLFVYDWEGNQEISFDGSEWNMNFHHDFTLLPNGNVIVLFDEKVSIEEALNLGIDSTIFISPQDHLVIDGFAEFDLSNKDEVTLVWEWHLKDHLIQNINPLLKNFHDPVDQPYRLDINFDSPSHDLLDWTHFNGVDYNPTMDQLVFSSRSTSEIYIIDHSTDTNEAASSSGGFFGKGGDFLWRWGNPLQYGHDSILQQTFVQHNPNWDLYGSDAQEGITLFNNENAEGTASSRILSVVPSKDAQGNYIFNEGRFAPDQADWYYEGMEEEFFSPIMSSAQLLENGNYISCLGRFGIFVELTSEGEIVWEYQCPVFYNIVPQYQNPPATITFSIFKYPMNFSGFAGKDLSPHSILENFNPISDSCIQSTATENIHKFSSTKIYPNPVYDKIQIETSKDFKQVEIFDMKGSTIVNEKFSSSIDISNLPKGAYLLKLKSKDRSEIHKIVVF